MKKALVETTAAILAIVLLASLIYLLADYLAVAVVLLV